MQAQAPAHWPAARPRHSGRLAAHQQTLLRWPGACGGPGQPGECFPSPTAAAEQGQQLPCLPGPARALQQLMLGHAAASTDTTPATTNCHIQRLHQVRAWRRALHAWDPPGEGGATLQDPTPEVGCHHGSMQRQRHHDTNMTLAAAAALHAPTRPRSTPARTPAATAAAMPLNLLSHAHCNSSAVTCFTQPAFTLRPGCPQVVEDRKGQRLHPRSGSSRDHAHYGNHSSSRGGSGSGGSRRQQEAPSPGAQAAAEAATRALRPLGGAHRRPDSPTRQGRHQRQRQEQQQHGAAAAAVQRGGAGGSGGGGRAGMGGVVQRVEDWLKQEAAHGAVRRGGGRWGQLAGFKQLHEPRDATYGMTATLLSG